MHKKRWEIFTKRAVVELCAHGIKKWVDMKSGWARWEMGRATGVYCKNRKAAAEQRAVWKCVVQQGGEACERICGSRALLKKTRRICQICMWNGKGAKVGLARYVPQTTLRKRDWREVDLCGTQRR